MTCQNLTGFMSYTRTTGTGRSIVIAPRKKLVMTSSSYADRLRAGDFLDSEDRFGGIGGNDIQHNLSAMGHDF